MAAGLAGLNQNDKGAHQHYERRKEQDSGKLENTFLLKNHPQDSQG